MCFILSVYVTSRTDVHYSRENATKGASQRGILTCLQQSDAARNDSVPYLHARIKEKICNVMHVLFIECLSSNVNIIDAFSLMNVKMREPN